MKRRWAARVTHGLRSGYMAFVRRKETTDPVRVEEYGDDPKGPPVISTYRLHPTKGWRREASGLSRA